MEQTYFLYDSKKAGEEGPSKAFLSSEAGGGSFLFTDKVIRINNIPMPESPDGSVKIVKSFNSEELIKNISGYEYADVARHDLNYELPAVSTGNRQTIEQRINSIREESMDVVAQFSHDYQVTPTKK